MAQHASAHSPLPWAILLAAGSGSRMGAATGNVPKQFLCYEGAPLYWHSALTMSRSGAVGGIVFVFPPESCAEQQAALATLNAGNALGVPWCAVAGGARRQDSVRHGLTALPQRCTAVLVHDSARPFASAALFHRVAAALHEGAQAVIPGIAVPDTIKITREDFVQQTLDRASLTAVQTPQGFEVQALVAAHERATSEGWDVTDDAALLEKCGVPVRVVAGDAKNSKITRPEDLAMLQSATPPLPCVGYGYDVHRFGPGRPLRLGGVDIPGGMEVMAHSDGDVLLHALMDAILGCACAGDIGQHFPDNDPRFDNADSAVLLDDVLRVAAQAGIRLCQVDLTIITQRPKISPYRTAIQKRVAALLSLETAFVNVKATTEEGLGFTGEAKGIKAVAVVTAQRTTTTQGYDI